MYEVMYKEQPLCRVNSIVEALEEITEDAVINELLYTNNTSYDPRIVRLESIQTEQITSKNSLRWLFEQLEKDLLTFNCDTALFDGIYRYWIFKGKEITLEAAHYYLKRSFLGNYKIKEILS